MATGARAVLRSVVPAVAILTVAVALAVWVNQLGAGARHPTPWTPPAGFDRVAAVNRGEDTVIALWVGQVDSPKSGSCWYLVRTVGGEDSDSFGACGGAGTPWLVRYAGVLAGGTGDAQAPWVRLDDGPPIATNAGYFLWTGPASAKTVSVELLDADGFRLAFFPGVEVGGG